MSITASDELYFQIYQAGGGVEPVGAMECHNATQAAGWSRAETIAALNGLIASGDVIATDGFTGLVETVRIAS